MNEFSGNTVIVFCTTCNHALKLSVMLRNLGFGAVPLHGQMTQSNRLAALHNFKANERQILIATDVASRGLDIPNVDLVINFELPINSKDYIHRVGRTARAGKAGRSITMVTQYDVELFQRIEQLVAIKMDLFPTQEEIVLVLLERVSEAMRLANVSLKEKQSAEKERAKKRHGRKKDSGESKPKTKGKKKFD